MTASAAGRRVEVISVPTSRSVITFVTNGPVLYRPGSRGRAMTRRIRIARLTATAAVVASGAVSGCTSSSDGIADSTVSTELSSVDLPDFDPQAVVPTRAAIDDREVAGWLDDALGVSREPASDPCQRVVPLMNSDVAARVVAVPDVVLAELLVNLDSALGGVEAACDSGDVDSAAAEMADAVDAGRAITQRLEELER
jgi:hypothetical protein